MRIIYYWFSEGAQFWLFTIYGKDVADDLTSQQKLVQHPAQLGAGSRQAQCASGAAAETGGVGAAQGEVGGEPRHFHVVAYPSGDAFVVELEHPGAGNDTAGALAGG